MNDKGDVSQEKRFYMITGEGNTEFVAEQFLQKGLVKYFCRTRVIVTDVVLNQLISDGLVRFW